MKISDYKPYEGFYDLRNYKMPANLFKKLWKIQDFLYFVEIHKKYYKEYLPAQWQKAQEISGLLQQTLFSLEKNKEAKNERDFVQR